MKVIAFFNNKGGVGKTSLVYHLAWMYADKGYNVIAVDFDPQANLTSMFLDEDRLEQLWPDGEHDLTVSGAIEPLIKGTGDIKVPHVEDISDNLGLMAGDLSLSLFEDELSDSWPRCLDRKERSFRVISAFFRLVQFAADKREAGIILIDLGPNLGSINRSALLAAEFVVVPLAPDLFSLQGLKNFGPTLFRWQQEWKERYSKNPDNDLLLPQNIMTPIGYVILQHGIRMDQPVKAYHKWMERIPTVYRKFVLRQDGLADVEVENDNECLSLLKHYRSLMPMAQEARKPIFS
ncbi:MAG TPA: AAA family ATPase, partial [Thermodesulfovibrionia bacterium]|nr:AAA family ATPase [Thermodesulfovibrionia bacterium]